MPEVRIDPEFQALIPALSAEERTQLEANLVADGCRDALVVWNGVLLDGHNRYEICTRLSITFDVRELSFSDRIDAMVWIIDNQEGRRNLNKWVRTELQLKRKALIADKARENLKTPTGGKKKMTLQNSGKSKAHTDREIAKAAKVSHDTVHRVEKLIEKAKPETIEKLRSGEVSINQAYQEVKTAEKRQQREKKLIEISEGNVELSKSRTYPVLYADPPWRYEHMSTVSREIENHYPTMSLEDICALPVQELATQDAVLFLWATSPKLEEALRVLNSWGFTYKTCAVWDKKKIGMGYYFRQQHELLLVGTRGESITPEQGARPASVQAFPRGKHSAKPEEFANLIHAMYPNLPKVELFARSGRLGWDTWGNQAYV